MARSQITLFVRRCLHQRVSPQEFVEFLPLVIKKWDITGKDIAVNLVTSAFDFCSGIDPLVSGYIQIVLSSQHVLVSEFLAILILRWQKTANNAVSDTSDDAQLLAVMLNDVSITASNMSLSELEARKSMTVGARWLKALFDVAASSDFKHTTTQTTMLVSACAVFLVTMMNIPAGLRLLRTTNADRDDALNSAIRLAIDGSMDTFPDISMQLLAEAQKHPALMDTSMPESDGAQVAEMAAMQFSNNVHNAPKIASRLATYTYLYHKLLNSSTIDETALYNFLDIRHSKNHGPMFNELLFASFDVMSKPLQAQEPLYQAQCRIYVHNKLPAILALIASFELLPTEQYLQELWNDLTTVGSTDNLTVAKHFLHVCTLHHLIAADTVQNLTGEDASATSAKGLFPKHALVEQVKANPARGPRLIEELTKNDGNAGAMGQAVVDVIRNYCNAKETQYLKEMANALVRQPSTINTIALFVPPSDFLVPICRLLDEWSWEDIHGESQAMYEEFGSVLLLLLTVKFRLNLPNGDLGIGSRTGFVAQYLTSGQTEAAPSSSADEQQRHLRDWIQNLYFEEGLSDEVTSSCSAKDFYLMIPTLLQQSMAAFSVGKLSQHKLEQGLDYLREPFLLASLLSSFAWLAKAVQKDAKSAKVILHRLVETPDNQDTKRLHRTILDIAAGIFRKTLSNHFEDAQYSDIRGAFGEYTLFSVNPSFKTEDLKTWTNEDGGIQAYLHRAISDLATIPNINTFQPNLLVAAIDIRGPTAIAYGMVAILAQSLTNHNFAQLLDIIATVIAASEDQRAGLRHALQLLHTKLGKLLKTDDNLMAEALVHLHRRVEIYCDALTPQQGTDDQDLMQISGVDMAEINLDQIPMDTDVTKQQTMALSQQDQLLGEDMDQMLNEAANMGTIDDYNDGTNDENMFNLDSYELTDLGDLDLEGF